LVLFFLNYDINKRKLRAETRNTELDADLKSIKLINDLTEKINNQEVRINKLETEVKALKGENHNISHELSIYEEAAKKLAFCPNAKSCPMEKEYHRLKENK